ncbi:MAG TPA: 2TM domain-containing protein [Bacteroidales bacterium]|nr:2TM domain-containing protein [Bacteroidales bacterium]HOH22431.1 2TM domain-containing protein [Bacteroidales bacterium]HPB56918.1 2TM domain-containing protein [Bacteroidales bacterium]HPZ03578.1 2TM domain-containing protein [Bacteroidales bacterium]HQB74964.1 2TM domain-containing protein [Bacteroidales bacterium]
MEQNQNQINEYGPLFNKAKKRVNFKIHAAIYLIILAILWVIWGFIFKNSSAETSIFLKSILFITIIWSIILIAHYLYAFKWNSALVERELQRMIKQMEKDKKSETELNQETKNNDEL